MRKVNKWNSESKQGIAQHIYKNSEKVHHSRILYYHVLETGMVKLESCID